VSGVVAGCDHEVESSRATPAAASPASRSPARTPLWFCPTASGECADRRAGPVYGARECLGREHVSDQPGSVLRGQAHAAGEVVEGEGQQLACGLAPEDGDPGQQAAAELAEVFGAEACAARGASQTDPLPRGQGEQVEQREPFDQTLGVGQVSAPALPPELPGGKAGLGGEGTDRGGVGAAVSEALDEGRHESLEPGRRVWAQAGQQGGEQKSGALGEEGAEQGGQVVNGLGTWVLAKVGHDARQAGKLGEQARVHRARRAVQQHGASGAAGLPASERPAGFLGRGAGGVVDQEGSLG